MAGEPTDQARAQLEAIEAVVALAEQAGDAVWLRGGWAMDFALGRVTRPHLDVDVFVDADGFEPLVDALMLQGWRDETVTPRDQHQPAGDGVSTSSPRRGPGRGISS